MLEMKSCHQCGARVLPMSNGTCPNCGVIFEKDFVQKDQLTRSSENDGLYKFSDELESCPASELPTSPAKDHWGGKGTDARGNPLGNATKGESLLPVGNSSENAAAAMTDSVKASKKRRLLALYLDLLLLLVPLGWLEHYVSTSEQLRPRWIEFMLTADGQVSFLLFILMYAFAEAVLWTTSCSPGLYMLSIGKGRRVPRRIYDRESWFPMLVGVLFILGGTKILVNLWTPAPVFGMTIEAGQRISLFFFLGSMSIMTGCLFLKLQPSGYWLGVILSIATLASFCLSWSAWDQEMVSEILAVRGREGNRGLNRFMQSFLPVFCVIWSSIWLILVAICYRYFHCVGNNHLDDACDGE